MERCESAVRIHSNGVLIVTFVVYVIFSWYMVHGNFREFVSEIIVIHIIFNLKRMKENYREIVSRKTDERALKKKMEEILLKNMYNKISLLLLFLLLLLFPICCL